MSNTEALRAAAQQALDALLYHVEMTRPIQKTSDAIVALRAALAEPASTTVNFGPALFTFNSFNGWVNRAQRAWKLAGVPSHRTVCVDSAGRVCAMGKDFMLARDEGTFPVTVYAINADDVPAPTSQQEPAP